MKQNTPSDTCRALGIFIIACVINPLFANDHTDSMALVPYKKPVPNYSALAGIIAEKRYEHREKETPKIIEQLSKAQWLVGNVSAFMNFSKKCSFFEDEMKLRESIRAWHHYTPKDAQRMSLVVLIHGTGASNAGWYRETDHEHFKGFLSFAEHETYTTNSAVDLISFGWTGNNTIEDRLTASETLVQCIKQIADRYDSITLIGHSHGGNIAFAASNTLSVPLRLILFATPMRNTNAELDERESIFTPGKNVTELYNIYSTGDALQALGSIRSGMSLSDIQKTAQSIGSSGSSRKIAIDLVNKKHYYNIDVTLDGQSPSHGNLRLSGAHLTTIMKQIHEQKSSCSDFDAAISTAEHLCIVKPHVATAKLDTSEWFTRRIWRLYQTARATATTLANVLQKKQSAIHCGEPVPTIA